MALTGLTSTLRKLQLVLHLCFVGAVALGVFSWSKLSNLPAAADIYPQSLAEPKQISISDEPFEFTYRGSSYLIEPIAEYQLSGLVVSHNDIEAFADIYHDENSVDVKDLCVIWGDNLRSDVFHEMKFWSEPWSCWYQAPTREIHRTFSGDNLSNNHLLASNESVRQAIMEASIGDQIQLEGKLVNYAPVSRPEWKRETSTVRNDQGNGACEVIFVDNFKIISSFNGSWRNLHALSYRVGIFLLLAEIILFLVRTYLDAYGRTRS